MTAAAMTVRAEQAQPAAGEEQAHAGPVYECDFYHSMPVPKRVFSSGSLFQGKLSRGCPLELGRSMSGYVSVRRFPTLTVQTPALDVRPLTADDAEPVAQIFADKQTQRWLPFPQEFGQIEGMAWCTEMAAERRDSGQGDHYGIVRREDKRLVGLPLDAAHRLGRPGHRDLLRGRRRRPRLRRRPGGR